MNLNEFVGSQFGYPNPFIAAKIMYNRPKPRPVSAKMLRFMFWLAIALLGAPIAPAVAQTLAQGSGGDLSFFGSLQAQLVNALAWIDGLGAIAPLAFILLYIVITVAFVPASVVTLGAGVVFGVVKGSALVFVGAMLGATAAFLVGRYGLRGWVASKIANNPRFQAIDDAIAQDGRKIIFLLRLSPVFPFNLLNYSLGLSQISLKDYVIGSVGMLPGTIMYVYLGSLVGNLATLGADSKPPEAATVQWIIRIVGLIATVAVTLYVTRIARRALNKALPPSSEVIAPDNS